MRSVALWLLAAAAGLALAAAVTIVASSLSTQRIGLSSEPLSAGEDLAPRAAAPPRGQRRPRPAPARSAPSEERGEQGHSDD